MYKRIILICPREFSKKDFIKNSIHLFIKNKIKLEVWIVSKVINPNYRINKKIIYKHKNFICKTFNSSIEFKNKLNSYLNYYKKNQILFDVRVGLNFSTIKFFKFFFFQKLNYIVFPGLNLNKNSYHFNVFLKIQYFLIKAIFFLSNIKIYKSKYIYMSAKKVILDNNLLISNAGQFIKGHSHDYDRFLESKNKIIKRYTFKYFVFLDQDEVHHSDFNRIKVNSLNEKKYYISLLNFFKKVEKRFKIKFVISPHPRGNIKMLKKYFGQRVSVKPTINLVKYSEFVFSHYSSAADYAFLFQKPLIAITNNELMQCQFRRKAITFFSQRTNSRLINISKEDFNSDDLSFDAKSYKKYIENYIKFNKFDKLRVDIIKDLLI